MRPQVKKFKAAAIHACQLKSFPFARFMGEFGLEAILLDAEEKAYSPLELAAHVLAECCVEAGRFNNFEVGFLTVVKFLSDQYGEPRIGQRQMFRDLLAILNTGGALEAIMGWMTTHYGQ